MNRTGENIMPKRTIRFLSFGAVLLLVCFSLSSQLKQDGAGTVKQLTETVYCLHGETANIAVFIGDDALLVVDSEYPKTAPDLLQKIRGVSPLPIKYLINTHYHGDHTGGNSVLGEGAEIISHKNCQASFLKTLKPGDDPATKGAPQTTYTTDMSLQVSGQTIRLLHLNPAHTSGDTVVVFPAAKVLVAGDLFFHGMAPYIDVRDGADTANWVLTIRTLAEKYPDYQIIPGHGQETDMSAWLKFADYLEYLRKEVKKAIAAGQTKEQAQESIDTSRFTYIHDVGQFLTKKSNIGWLYDELTR
jgi:glyoxylase-like metal-dependent hydrolase (beta-lactamase superfamily II)